MSRPKLLPPLAPETLACLDCLQGSVSPAPLAPRHRLNAEANAALMAIIMEMNRAEKHLREMSDAHKAGTLVSTGTCADRPLRVPAQFAKRALDRFTEVSNIAIKANDSAFPLHVTAINDGLKNKPMPLRYEVWIAWRWCCLAGRPRLSDEEMEQLLESQSKYSTCGPPPDKPPHVPTAGDIAEFLRDTERWPGPTARDAANHLKALGLPYAPARRGYQKSK